MTLKYVAWSSVGWITLLAWGYFAFQAGASR